MSEKSNPVSRCVQRPIRCLVVDDERPLLRGLQRVLGQRRPQWEVHCAPDAATALKLLETRCFDCVVTDLQMPGMDGLTFLALVRNRYPHCVRVVHSSQIETIGRHRVASLCHRLLSKPATPDEVIDTLAWAVEPNAPRSETG